MLIVRPLVLLGSLVQLLLGGWLAWRLLWREVPDPVAIGICGVVLFLGFASAAALAVPRRPSASRTLAARLNMAILALIVLPTLALAIVELAQGVEVDRIRTTAAVAALASLPFLVNGLGLAWIERCSTRAIGRLP